MKTWLAKLRISMALDSGVSSQKKTERDEIRCCADSMQTLDRQLKTAHPTLQSPPALHASIMRAVRTFAKPQERRYAPKVLRWLPAPALALFAVIGLLWLLNPSRDEPLSWVGATAALEQSHEITQKAPAAALAPLSQEMENLNRDFQNAVEFLLASVP